MDTQTQARLERHRAFWRRENHDRPLVGFNGSYFPIDTIRVLRTSGQYLSPSDIDVEAFLDQCDAQYAAWRDATGDLFWTASPLPVFYRWLCGALGQPLSVRSQTIWAHPYMADYSRLDRLVLRDDDPWVEALWGLTGALVARSAGRYPVAAAAVLGPLASLADMRGPTDFAGDVIADPDGLQRAMACLTDSWVRLATENFKRLPPFHGGYASAVRFVWAPGQMVEFDEDSSFVFSPKTHRQFVMPHHRELVRHFDYPFIHLHSALLHTLDNLLELDGLAAIELTPDYGTSLLTLVPAIRKALAKKPVIVHGYLDAGEMRRVMQELPPEGLCLVSRRDTPEEAKRLQAEVLG